MAGLVILRIDSKTFHLSGQIRAPGDPQLQIEELRRVGYERYPPCESPLFQPAEKAEIFRI